MMFFLLPMAALLLTWSSPAQTSNAQPVPASGGESTVITSDSLDLNLSKNKGAKQGLFRGNVKVDEPRFTMSSDEMTVFFAEDDSVQTVEARGKVLIERKDKTSKTESEKAIYDMKEKKLTLIKVTSFPKAIGLAPDGRTTNRVVRAETIILYPEEDRMETKGKSMVEMQKP